VVRATPAGAPGPGLPRDRVRQGPPPPSKPITGRILALLLGGMFVAAVLVISEKAFGAAGHPLLGIFVGLACLLSSALIYWRTSKSRS
jgi:hypothetical protein